MPPAVLYKYMPPSRASAIEDRELRFTPPSEFIDYFESFPRVAGPNRDSVRRKLSAGEDLDDVVARATPHFQQHGPQTVFDEVSRTFGVLSLATHPDNPLLWAQYSAGHRGFAIGFHSSHSWFNSWQPPMPPIDGLQEVCYADDRPEVIVGRSDHPRPGEPEQQAQAMLCTKFTPWRYEEEWRLIRPLERADRVCKAEDGKRIHLFRFPSEAVAEVVVGARIAPADLDRLRRALSAAGLEPAPLRMARRSPTSTSFLLDLLVLDQP